MLKNPGIWQNPGIEILDPARAWSPPDNPIQFERASSLIMEFEDFILPAGPPPDDPIQSERAKHASSSIMECEEFILPDWSPPDDPARVLVAVGRLKPIH